MVGKVGQLQFCVLAVCCRAVFSFRSGGSFRLVGSICQPSVAWGNFARFVAYTGKLNWFLPV
jgi:hypothetical protein